MIAKVSWLRVKQVRPKVWPEIGQNKLQRLWAGEE